MRTSINITHIVIIITLRQLKHPHLWNLRKRSKGRREPRCPHQDTSVSLRVKPHFEDAQHPPTSGSEPRSQQTMTGPGGRRAEIRVSGAAPATRMLPALRPRPEAYPPPSDSHSRSGFDLGSSAVRLPVADLRPAASRYVTGCAQPKMAALLCSPGLGPRVSGRRAGARRVGGGCPGLWVTLSRPHTGAFLEPRAALCLARPAHLRRVRQGEPSEAGVLGTRGRGRGYGTSRRLGRTCVLTAALCS